MSRNTCNAALLAAVLMMAGCETVEEEQIYQQVAVERRDIIVTVEAAGVIEPALTVELKSKASGEILEINGETGDLVEAGALLVQIDKRTPRNQLAQAEATLEAATARRGIAEAQARRAERLLADGIINEVEYEQSQLELANARAEVVRSEVSVESTRIQMEDTDLRSPITGTIIERLVERGQVISSPTMDVGGGTLLLTMADLGTVQVRALVDETDIGQIEPGQAAEVTVRAFPARRFQGEVQKIEPQALAEQTVTTFAVLIMLDNSQGLLRPGMNAEVRIVAAERSDVLAVPTMALRTLRDIRTSAALVGLDEQDVRSQLAGSGATTQNGARPERAAGAPAGAMATGRPGEGQPAGGRPGARPGATDAQRYWVFRMRDGFPEPVWIESGLTDLDVSEVLSGLAEGDRVLMLPSSGLIEAQQRMQQRMRQFNAVPGMGGGGQR
ncbi:MAG: efflux RND transporter periplasmic adaptor subunit [Chromatiales bacterium]|nr:efflux RND transporter periplasmic adaptor subunit [Chromatiales bacterium]